MMLRSMQQAVYEPHCDGHFGLAYSAYAHFTSPIRRYPDLTVHRAIKAVLNGQTYQPIKPGRLWVCILLFCERRADDASRDVENWLKTYYMRDKVGEVFSGKISGMTSFGIFVTLDDIHTTVWYTSAIWERIISTSVLKLWQLRASVVVSVSTWAIRSL